MFHLCVASMISNRTKKLWGEAKNCTDKRHFDCIKQFFISSFLSDCRSAVWFWLMSLCIVVDFTSSHQIDFNLGLVHFFTFVYFHHIFHRIRNVLSASKRQFFLSPNSTEKSWSRQNSIYLVFVVCTREWKSESRRSMISLSSTTETEKKNWKRFNIKSHVVCLYFFISFSESLLPY